MHLRGKITTLKKERTYYQKKIEEDSRKMQELLSNTKNLEKFAREQYFMKKTNEDIFVIVKEWKVGRILAIDYGKKRVGLAVSDSCKIIATGKKWEAKINTVVTTQKKH